MANPHCFNSLNSVVQGGLYDVAYGSCDSKEVCSTCYETSRTCTGHLGHIELPVPVYNPLFFKVWLWIFLFLDFIICKTRLLFTVYIVVHCVAYDSKISLNVRVNFELCFVKSNVFCFML